MKSTHAYTQPTVVNLFLNPKSVFNFATSSGGPMKREVPVSAIAWQPKKQLKLGIPPMLILMESGTKTYTYEYSQGFPQKEV